MLFRSVQKLDAVNDALRPIGVKLLHSPISPRRLVEAVLQARQSQGEPA